MVWSEDLGAYTYPCPCGALFQISLDDLRLGEEVARCPSYSLFITVVYNPDDFVKSDGGVRILESRNRPPISIS